MLITIDTTQPVTDQEWAIIRSLRPGEPVSKLADADEPDFDSQLTADLAEEREAESTLARAFQGVEVNSDAVEALRRAAKTMSKTPPKKATEDDVSATVTLKDGQLSATGPVKLTVEGQHFTPSLTLDDAVTKASALMSEGKRDEVKAALVKAGAGRVSELEPEQLSTFMDALDD